MGSTTSQLQDGRLGEKDDDDLKRYNLRTKFQPTGSDPQLYTAKPSACASTYILYLLTDTHCSKTLKEIGKLEYWKNKMKDPKNCGQIFELSKGMKI